jgi:hypothetical protein
VRERRGHGALLTKFINPVLGGPGREDDKAHVFGIGDGTKSRLGANRL